MSKILHWLLTVFKVGVFFTLFAFALNNLEDVKLNFFFGHQWTGPMILVVLAVFTLGVMVGVLGMLPRWWAHRRALANHLLPIHTADSMPAKETTANLAPATPTPQRLHSGHPTNRAANHGL
jgi:uncharacterized integral membrane protein